MHLDVILPTYNRATLLARTLESLRHARLPADLAVTVTVVDNNSTDETRRVVEGAMPGFGGRLHYLFEAQSGKSHALNSGIAATGGELVGMIDDDEEVDPSWFEVVDEIFRDPTVDFAGGPYKPRWGAEPPAWLPPRPSSIVGWVEPSDRVHRFGDPSFNAMLMGGNAVVRRALLERVGPYATTLGPTSKRRLGSGEDHDMYLRLLAAGGRGIYRPDLVIHHHIPATRLERRYHRRWTFWHAVSVAGVPDDPSFSYWFGIPRFVWGSALRGVLATVREGVRLAPRAPDWARFDRELAWWDIAGRLYARVAR